MNCPDDPKLLAYAEGTLSTSALEGLDEHLDACDACRELVAELVRTAPSASDAPTVTLEPAAPPKTDAPRRPQIAPLTPGSHLDRYRILELIGTGGMGMVYAADDPHLGRTVALKVLRPDLDARADSETWLLGEARAMARLSHPNVAAVFDAGTSAGRVFISMELVEGTTLRQWLRERPRTLEEILEVFRAAGRGLAAAHEAGLVHRDFKPGNVLVGERQEVKVVDFGLARPEIVAEEDRETRDGDRPRQDPFSVHLTSSGMLVGTPAYMAPEQQAGRPADALSDQFSYCVALYEALYGQHPFAGDDLSSIRRSVKRGEVRDAPKGSRVPSFLRQRLLRGLSVRLEDRFESMDALLAALGRFPRKRRRRLAAAAAAVLALAGAVVLTYAALDPGGPVCSDGAHHLAGIWDGERKLTLGKAFASSGEAIASDTWRRAAAALDRYARDWSQMHEGSCRATHVSGEQSAAMLDLRMECLRRRLGELGALVKVFERPDKTVIRKAVRASKTLTPLAVCADVERLRARGRPSPKPSERANVDRVHALLAKAKATLLAGKYAGGLPIARQAVALAKATRYRPAEGEALLVLGDYEEELGRYTAAVGSYQRSISRAHAGRDDRLATQAAVRLVTVAGYRLARYDVAERWATFASSGLERIGRAPTLAARLEAALAATRFGQGRYREAYERQVRAVAALEKSVGTSHPDLPEALSGLAVMLRNVGKRDEALRQYRRALEIGERVFGSNHPDVAGILHNLAVLHYHEHRNREALRLHRRARKIFELSLGKRHVRVAKTVYEIASTLSNLGRHREALVQAREALELFRGALGPDHPRVAMAHVRLGTILRLLKRYPEALRQIRLGMSLYRKKLRPGHPFIADAYITLGLTLRVMGRSLEAVAAYRRALALWQTLKNPRKIARIQNNLGVALTRAGRFDEASQALRQAIETREKILGPSHRLVAQSLGNLALLEMQRHRYLSALAAQKRALAIRGRLLPPAHPLLAHLHLQLGRILLKLGRAREAEQVLEKAAGIYRKHPAKKHELAGTRFALARALAARGKSRKRALRLARLARDEWARGGRERAEDLARVKRWLKRHGNGQGVRSASR